MCVCLCYECLRGGLRTHIHQAFWSYFLQMWGSFTKSLYRRGFTKSHYRRGLAKLLVASRNPIREGALYIHTTYTHTHNLFFSYSYKGASRSLSRKGLCKAPTAKGFHKTVQRGLCKVPRIFVHTHIHTYAHFYPYRNEDLQSPYRMKPI